MSEVSIHSKGRLADTVVTIDGVVIPSANLVDLRVSRDPGLSELGVLLTYVGKEGGMHQWKGVNTDDAFRFSLEADDHGTRYSIYGGTPDAAVAAITGSTDHSLGIHVDVGNDEIRSVMIPILVDAAVQIQVTGDGWVLNAGKFHDLRPAQSTVEVAHVG